MPLISVIVPNYNHAAYLRQRIDSIINQTYQDIEIILLDDASKDNSRQVIEEYRGHGKVTHIVYNEENSGSPFKQWKKGISLAAGEWIWIAESDDFASPGFLDKVMAALPLHPSADLVYCDSYTVLGGGQKLPERFSERKNSIFGTTKWSQPYFRKGIDEINESLKFDCTINNMSSVVFRKGPFMSNSAVVDSYKYYGDWYFLLKACLKTDICYVAEPLNYYRKHESSHLHRETSLLISRQEYFQILQLLYYENSVTNKDQLLDHFAYHYLSFGLSRDGLKTGWRILRSYREMDKDLAWKIINRIIRIKLFRQKRAFFVPRKKNN